MEVMMNMAMKMVMKIMMEIMKMKDMMSMKNIKKVTPNLLGIK